MSYNFIAPKAFIPFGPPIPGQDTTRTIQHVNCIFLDRFDQQAVGFVAAQSKALTQLQPFQRPRPSAVNGSCGQPVPAPRDGFDHRASARKISQRLPQ